MVGYFGINGLPVYHIELNFGCLSEVLGPLGIDVGQAVVVPQRPLMSRTSSVLTWNRCSDQWMYWRIAQLKARL
jgi:hypothetical protein